MTTLQGELLARLSVAAAFAFLAMVYSGFVTDETNPTRGDHAGEARPSRPGAGTGRTAWVPQDDSGA